MTASSRPGTLATTATTADTEYEITIPRGTRQFAIFTNTASAILRVSEKADEVATPNDQYLSIPSGEQYFATDIYLEADLTMYVASDTNSTTVLVHYWS